MMGRERIIRGIGHVLKTLGLWGDVDERNPIFEDVFQIMKRSFFWLPTAVISIKTDHGVHEKSPNYRGKLRSVPPFGDAHEFYRKYAG